MPGGRPSSSQPVRELLPLISSSPSALGEDHAVAYKVTSYVRPRRQPRKALSVLVAATSLVTAIVAIYFCLSKNKESAPGLTGRRLAGDDGHTEQEGAEDVPVRMCEELAGTLGSPQEGGVGLPPRSPSAGAGAGPEKELPRKRKRKLKHHEKADDKSAPLRCPPRVPRPP